MTIKGQAVNSGVRGSTPVLAKPWLRPSVEALLALTDSTPDLGTVLADPGLVLHILRFSRPTPRPDSFELDARTFAQPWLFETAARLWELDSTELPQQPAAHRLGLHASRIAHRIAQHSDLCSADAASAAALLAPLPWYVGEDSPALTRRLLQRWRMPEWLIATIGYPELGIDDAVRLGAPAGLIRVVRAAIQLAEAHGEPIGLASPFEGEVSEWAAFAEEPVPDIAAFSNIDAMLLPRLLRMTAKALSKSGAERLLAAEDRIDELVQTLANSRSDFELALRDAKLASLAEFAAGASHEINNPLAVIAGNVQLLKNLDPDPEYQTQLATILRQTKRIHEILHGTRQFARPTPPHRELLRADSLLDAVRKELEPEAEARGATLEIAGASGTILGDAQQLRIALGHVVRNALEAAGPGGWVHLAGRDAGDAVEFAITDSGPGPAPEALPHLFDPFFSGREAGRGRGLGLPIAWRTLRAHGGDVRFAPTSKHPSRFTVSLPAAPQGLKLHPAERMSA